MDKVITLDHGAGGLGTEWLVNHLTSIYGKPTGPMEDSAILQIGGMKIAFTTDSFVVDPPVFRGGDIGKLSVCGTVNDLASMGAKPLCLSLSMVLEEGLSLDILETVSHSIHSAAAEADVRIVAGDTKVVRRGEVDPLILNTSGLGIVPDDINISVANAKPGDVVVINGYVGDHGISILSLREGLGFENNVISDCAPLNTMILSCLDKYKGIHVIRDATRGGLATILTEIATASSVGIQLNENSIPVRPETHMACELLGLDPLYLANEGKMVILVAESEVDGLMNVLRSHPYGKNAAIIGRIAAEHPKQVILRKRTNLDILLRPLSGISVPRLC